MNRWKSHAVNIKWLAVPAVVCLLTGCPTMTTDDGLPDDMTDGSTAARLQVDFSGLESLGGDFVYEGWLIVDGAPVSTGRFSVDEDGNAVPAEFDVDAADADAATVFVLTIEPVDDADPGPADTHVLAGDFDGGAADLTIGHDAALGDDFTTAVGSFILNTPSSADTDDDFDQGIWWLDPAAGPGPSLILPELPAGWMYEGWVVDPDGPVSTGRFSMASGIDSDAAGATSGPDDAPPFPGQDFIDPPVVLIDYTAVISVEPDPDDGDGPFAIKPLVDMTIEDVGIGVLQTMETVPDNAPTGTATIMDE